MTEPLDLDYVKTKAARLVAIEDKLEEMAEEIERLEEEQKQIREFQLPEAIFELGLDPPIVGVGNRIVEIEPLILASLPKEDNPQAREKALNYVIDLGLGGNIKRALELDLPKGDAIMERKVVDALNAISKALKPHIKTTIHHMTYTAMVKGLVRAGTLFDKDKLNAMVGSIARVKKVKDD
jgi:hypothetical protein